MRRCLLLLMLIAFSACAFAEAPSPSAANQPQSSVRVIHFSVDDVAVELQDLIEHGDSYRSIWSSPYFSLLRRAHRSSGCCVTLNCFTDIDGFQITALPENSVWQRELQSASDWLRFGFHAGKNRKYRAEQSMLPDYLDFVQGILQLTGSPRCIDRVTRLGYFSGSEDQLTALRDAEPGCIGFLCADSAGAVSYCLSAEEGAQVWNEGSYYSESLRLRFIRSLPRLDAGVSADDIIRLIREESPAASQYVEVFFHSPVRSAKISAFARIAKWAVSHGYANAFPMDSLTQP